MVEFQAISWEPRDTEEGFTITAYGRTREGKSVSATTLFQPYFFIQIPNWTTPEALWAEFKENLSNPKLELTQSVPMMGFTNNEKKKFMKLSFKTHEQMRKFVWRCKNKKLRVFESNIDPLLRFLHRTGIESVGWMTVENSEPDFSTTCDIRVFTPDWRNFKSIANDSLAPFRLCSLDIECYSSTGIFPNPDVKDDDLFQIALTTSTYGTKHSEQVCFSLGNVSGPNIVQCSDENDLLTKFSEYIIKHDPDVITGWNVFGFDFEYIYKRMVRSKCQPYTRCLGRRLDAESEIVIKNLSSGALGANVLKMLPMVGRYTFDLFQTVKAEHKLESYSLNAVSLNFLGDKKNDMPIKQMFKMYEEKQDLSEIALYCIKDTELPIKIMEKLNTFENLVEMAKATWVPLSFLSERGQQIKVFSQIAKKARELGFMVPTIFDKPTVSQFEGATVLDAQCGAYYKPIVGLDFAGLYPSIMIAHNLCYSTLVIDEKYANIPGVEYERYGDHLFAQNVPSLLPMVLNDLKMFRKKAKQDMKKAKGTPMESIYDGKQLAYKISMNSIYGFTGASNGILPCVAIASTVTCRGRQMIQASKEYVEEHFPGAKVRYGDTDSIMVEFDVGSRKGQEAIDYSWSLGEQASEQITKIFKQPNELELEKVYCPYFLYSKKRYAAKKWVKNDTTQLCDFVDVEIKGLQVVRRDNCQFVRETCRSLVDMLMESSNPEKPLRFIMDQKAKLKNGQVPMSELILSKRLGDSYKNTNLAHVVVRDKMRERAPGSEPRSGDRVQFVVIQTPKNQKKMYEKAEDPGYVTEHRIPLDYDWYVKHQFDTPVKDLIEPLVN
jgi:DNA polymerase delta subunit 1